MVWRLAELARDRETQGSTPGTFQLVSGELTIPKFVRC